MIRKELLDILACPACKAEVKEENGKLVCQNPKCGLLFQVKDGIPIMLIDEAQKPGR
jgi:hypothetical protein